MTTEGNRCRARRKDGQPCGAPGLRGGGYCFTHSPATAEARITARQRGGANSAKIIRLRSLIPPRLLGAYELLEKALGKGKVGSSRWNGSGHTSTSRAHQYATRGARSVRHASACSASLQPSHKRPSLLTKSLGTLNQG